MKNSILQSLGVVVVMTFLIVSTATHSAPRQKPLGLFEGQSDVGKVNQPGSAVYDDEKEEYTVAGSGTNMWADHDEFHFLWKRMRGNFILTARTAFIVKGVEAHRKIGWIVRPSLETDSAQVSAVLHGNGLTSLHTRQLWAGRLRRAFLDGKQPEESFYDGLEVTELLMAAYMSAEQERTIEFRPDGLDTYVPLVAQGLWKGR